MVYEAETLVKITTGTGAEVGRPDLQRMDPWRLHVDNFFFFLLFKAMSQIGAAQYKKKITNKQSDQNMGRRSTWTLLQRRQYRWPRNT